MDDSARDQAEPGSDPAAAFARLYDNEMPRVYRYLSYHVSSREEAEDLTADVFQQALRHWSRVSSELNSPRAWLMTLATHRLSDHFRRRRPASPLDDRFDLPADQPDPEATALQREEVATLLARLAGLPERDRTVLTLRFAADLGHREIGEVLGISEGASAVALLRALRRLRATYQGEGQ